MAKDLTKGSTPKILIGFTIPLLVGNVFQQLYNMADTFIVGRTISMDALAGVGSIGSIMFFIIGFCQSLTTGFSILPSQYYGGKDYENLKKSVASLTIWCGFFAVVVTTLSLIFAKDILVMMKTPSEIFDYAYIYLLTVLAGIPATILFNMTSNIIRALGDSKTPLIFLAVGCFINIALDILFIVTFKMGVLGAGLATVASQLFTGIVCLIFMLKKLGIVKFKRHHLSKLSGMMKRQLFMGLPLGLQSSIIALGTISIQIALNSLGKTYVAAYIIAVKIDNFASLPLMSIGIALSAFIGQNYGFGDLKRIKDGVKWGFWLSMAYSVIIGIVVIFFGDKLSMIFASSEDDLVVVNLSAQFLFYTGLFYWSLGLIFTFRYAVQGLGRGGLTLLSGGMELAMRVFFAFVISPKYGFEGMCFSNPMTWLSGGLIMVACYLVVIRKISKRGISLDNNSAKELKT